MKTCRTKAFDTEPSSSSTEFSDLLQQTLLSFVTLDLTNSVEQLRHGLLELQRR